MVPGLGITAVTLVLSNFHNKVFTGQKLEMIPGLGIRAVTLEPSDLHNKVSTGQELEMVPGLRVSHVRHVFSIYLTYLIP